MPLKTFSQNRTKMMQVMLRFKKQVQMKVSLYFAHKIAREERKAVLKIDGKHLTACPSKAIDAVSHQIDTASILSLIHI